VSIPALRQHRYTVVQGIELGLFTLAACGSMVSVAPPVKRE
jgi:hypothetical protein